MKAAIVGAGPSGFYTADGLLRRGFNVDLYDKLPTPFGLVRAGVAPDHPRIKSVTRVYDKVAARPGFRFFGGVELGADVSRDELRERYDAVVYTLGTARDKRLGIPGEDLPGSHPATHFVSWYNGHPEYADHEFDLSVERAVVIGNGNVAGDLARMLVLDGDELSPTDTADHAMRAFGHSGVREVVILGRRGPAQAAFTSPELLELGELSRADVVVDPSELALDPASAAWLESDEADKVARRNVEILQEFAERAPSGKSHRIVLRFLASPVEIVEDSEGAVAGIRVVRNRIEEVDGRLCAVATSEGEVIPCGLVLRSVGYRGDALEDVPFDEDRGLIRNLKGRVIEADGTVSLGEYTAGWIKRGPSGEIGTNKKCAAETVAAIAEDVEAGAMRERSRPDAAEIEAWLRERVPDHVTWDRWQAIDAHETAAGEPHGRPRIKLVRVDEMRSIAAAAGTSTAGAR